LDTQRDCWSALKMRGSFSCFMDEETIKEI
jgi:hypothetical protein